MVKKAILLVAEANDDEFVVIEKNLQKIDHPVEILRFTNSQDLLDALKSIRTAETVLFRPTLLFLDYQLPKAGGLEVLEAIKEDPKLKKLPVIILLTTEKEEVLEECYRRGCGFCLRKPEDFHRFSEVVRRVSDFLSVVELPEIALLNPAGTEP